MKTKRILALLLALVMLFALAACGESKAAGDSALKESLESAANEAKAEAAPAAEAAPEPTPEPTSEPTPEPTPEPTLIGEWVCEKDMREMMIEELGSADPDSAKFFNEYMKEFILVMTLELREDGSFSLRPDFSKAQQHVFEAFRSYIDDSLKAQGITFTDEQLDQYAQMAVDQMGLDLDAIEGDYVDENGTLKLADSDPVPYVLTGTTLEFTVEEFGDLKFDRVG